MDPILVTGGTGTAGRLVVARLREAGRDVRVLTRSARPRADGVTYVTGDLTTGDGVAAALDGVGSVINCAGANGIHEQVARTLARSAAAAGVRHLVHLSVVGAERVRVRSRFDRQSFGYFDEMRHGELAVEGSGAAWTTLRATQFHDLIATAAGFLVKSPVVPSLTRMRFQPVEADDVAARLVALVDGEPHRGYVEIGGPEVLPMKELLRQYLDARGLRRVLLPVRLPGAAAASIRDGANLTPDHADGTRTWADFLTGGSLAARAAAARG
ncbi:NmrA family protein [Beutenbergia cavernae DSM 12333]|uniref:NmrA family protein n=1 Tax=Beutenbergia cavernae (strain ATCC BAA-8 / DSM 12333 / CCUG 43141 / JCM 11478 / NBRC 16432 / NCIMB 13614 / HKI 0122) TaxID=471853 RepID=C5C5Z0_BEUC1|nr:NAD(P)H-binding protein [Beutenbergia cavernae]ACQ82348.1 NmrA family protein [Beutenbergia cavernae DSM 12333]